MKKKTKSTARWHILTDTEKDAFNALTPEDRWTRFPVLQFRDGKWYARADAPGVRYPLFETVTYRVPATTPATPKRPALATARRRVASLRNRILRGSEHHRTKGRKYTVFPRKGAEVSAHTRGPCWVVRAHG